MGALKNPRHERFCQIFPRGKMQGLSQGEIYRLAGFSAQSDHSAETMASRLMQRPDIRNRIAEIAQYSVTKAQIDVDNLLSKTERVYHQSVEDREHGSANKAVELQGKLSGNLVDRMQIDASIEFSGLKTADDILDAFISQLGEGDVGAAIAALDDLKDQLIARAAAKAHVVNGSAVTQLPTEPNEPDKSGT
jgi:phage terminase small subunit